MSNMKKTNGWSERKAQIPTLKMEYLDANPNPQSSTETVGWGTRLSMLFTHLESPYLGGLYRTI